MSASFQKLFVVTEDRAARVPGREILRHILTHRDSVANEFNFRLIRKLVRPPSVVAVLDGNIPESLAACTSSKHEDMPMHTVLPVQHSQTGNL